MVLLVRSCGNHSNRLFQNLHIEAFCIENNIPFFNPTLYDMVWLFAFPYNYSFAFLILVLFKIATILRLTRCRAISYVECTDARQLETYKQQLLRGRTKLVLVGGWEFRVHDLVAKHAKVLKEKYSIKKSTKEFFILSAKIKEYEIVLGVHIRRKDYTTWQGGKFAFDDTVYNRFVNNFITLHPGKRILVIFFSDEVLTMTSLCCPVDYLISKNKYYIDYRLMGKCNYLIGPPSTFTLWASFCYGVPYVHMEDPQQVLHLEDFKICGQR
jgi:hypothetical protein